MTSTIPRQDPSDLLAASAHERRVSRRLEARGQNGLGDALCRLHGVVVGGQYRIDTLYAVGAEGAVYLATDLHDREVPQRVAKIPLLPFHRPADLSVNFLRRRREGLREEARNLHGSASPYMPAFCGAYEFENPLLDPLRGGEFAQPEPVLVMERLPGFDLDGWLARMHRSDVPRALLRRNLDRVAVVLLQALWDLQERGYYYADLRPGNLRMMGRPERRIRLLDAGSLVERGDESGKFPHVPAYLPPELFHQRQNSNRPIVPSAAVQSVMAGRTLFEVATGLVPVPGEQVDNQVLWESNVSEPVADVVEGLCTGSFENVLHALRFLSRHARRRRPQSLPQPAIAAASADDRYEVSALDAPRAAPAVQAPPPAAAEPPAPAPQSHENRARLIAAARTPVSPAVAVEPQRSAPPEPAPAPPRRRFRLLRWLLSP